MVETPNYYVLRDDVFERYPLDGIAKDQTVFKLFKNDWIGRAIMGMPFEAHKQIDFTGPPGSVSGIYYSLVFQLRKWEYNVAKFDEWIEVSPVHVQYYNLTHKQKEELETRIKSGLQSVSQSVADMEMLLHDLRKYEEFMRYLGYRTPKETPKECKKHEHTETDKLCLKVDDDDKTRKAREQRIDNHSLKAVFIDQVDMHTGDGISIRSIVSRWPTLIIDFMRMNDGDTDVNSVAKDLDISRAEAVVLITKNKLFMEWKKLFLETLKGRYQRILQLTRAREKSVEEYRDWLKPLVTRHKIIAEGLSQSGNREKAVEDWAKTVGNAVSSTNLVIWVWKDFAPPEFYRIDPEAFGKASLEGKISPNDKWTQKHLIFNKKYGLIKQYPWITKEWVKKKLEDFYTGGQMTRSKYYYSFFIIKLQKTNIKMPTGDELEDGVFDVNTVGMSQNVMFTKLLELEAKKYEMNRYVDEMVGEIVKGPSGQDEITKERLAPARKFLDNFSLPLTFFKKGPYEPYVEDRFKNIYMGNIAGRYGKIVEFIEQKMGMGTS